MKQGAKILVVDDEPMVRDAISRLLEHLGYDVEEAEGGQAALALLGQRIYDLVITDFSMPGMQGDELVANIREKLPAQRIVMVTAFVEEFKVFGQSAGTVDALLLKPFSFKELSETVERVLAQERACENEDVVPPNIHRRVDQDYPPPKEL